MSFYLNTVTASRELEGSAIDKAIMAMAARIAKIRNAQDNSNSAVIDLTMMLPGKSEKPDFQGMRMTSFASVEKVLYIESAVPEAMLHSEHAERYISAVLQDAFENAKEFFSEQGVSFSEEPWRELL
jgi:hypothetical protein